MKKNILFVSLLSFVAVPMMAFAATTAFDILLTVQKILNVVIPLLITLAVVYFIWGVIQYTISSDEEAKKNARSKIIMSLIGLFVIVAFWGIIEVVRGTFKVGNGGNQLDVKNIPNLPCRDANTGALINC
jgi:hypothetical protein